MEKISKINIPGILPNAEIEVDTAIVEQTVQDYLAEYPIEAPVQSVNGKTGAVVLGASDVGALPSDTVIPPAVTEQDVAGWGFTKNTGTYSKPTGGIPKTDLASDVQTSLGKADTALQQHQSLAGYATESYVQTQIAAIPDELPDATSASANDFLCLNTQKQPIWKTVPSAESNSFGGGS